MAEEHAKIESVLCIDCGTTVTRVHLLDRVEGRYRLLARVEVTSTLASPWCDLMASVRQAMDQLTRATGRRLTDDAGQILCPASDGAGVDAVTSITSAGEPLRLVLAGITRAGLDSARRAVPPSHAAVEGIIAADPRQGDVVCRDFEGQARLLQELLPDAIVMVGGHDGAANETALQTARAVAWACSTLPSLRDSCPAVLFAGNVNLQDRVSRLIGPGVDFHAVDNVRPSAKQENPGPLRAEIDELYRQRQMQRLPGFEELNGWSAAPVLPAASAFACAIKYLASTSEINVAGVDLGGAKTTVATVIDGRLDLAVRRDLGLGTHAAHILDFVPLESVLRWLPFEMDDAEAHNALLNKSIHWRTLPQTPPDLFLEQAVAREALRLTLSELERQWEQGTSRSHASLPKFHLVVGAGGVLANVPDSGQAALILLDGLQPVGACGLALDRVGLVAPLGAVAGVNPLAAAEVMSRDALLKLGTVIALAGTAREGEPALTCRIEYQDGRSLVAEVPAGSLRVIPLPAGQRANLELRPTRHFDVGLGVRGQAGATQVEGGVLGIIIDARGRPLPVAESVQDQQQKVQRWLGEMGALASRGAPASPSPAGEG